MQLGDFSYTGEKYAFMKKSVKRVDLKCSPQEPLRARPNEVFMIVIVLHRPSGCRTQSQPDVWCCVGSQVSLRRGL